ncbi:RNA-directed DNA polymerase, eukaryota, reverse transcriptase zinc-binding domain protein [Tanacetum coccineum]
MDWKNKSLSAAGRLQLVKSVIGSMHVYWASVFILPSRVLLDFEQLMRNYLWSHGDSQKGKSNVAWEVVCLPMKEGGLGVKWVHTYKLRDRHFFEVPLRGNMTWGWRKLLQLYPLIRDHFWVRIGDGATCLIWFDKWCSNSPLACIVTPRDIHRAGLDMSSNVKDVMHNGGWDWPIELSSKYPILNTIATLTISTSLDTLEWHSNDGVTMPFSVATVWNYLRPRATEVPWYNVVWFNHCIPRHAFHMWLVVKRRLKTHDMLRQWDLTGSFGTLIKVMALSCLLYGSIDIIIDTLIPMSKRRSARSVVAKIVVAACCYYIWQEQNFRLFKNLKRSPQQVIRIA